MDTSGSGSIDYSEYLAASLSKRRFFTEDRLQQAFRLFDTEEKGFISVDEIKNIFNKGVFSDLDEDIWLDLVQEAADQGEGKITFEHFKSMMAVFVDNDQITQSLRL